MISLRLEMYLECSTCRCNKWHDDSNDFDIALFGIEQNYMVCPRCKNEVSEEISKDKNYRQRYRVHVARLKRLRIIEMGKLAKAKK